MKRVILFLALLAPITASSQGFDGSGNVVRGDGTRTGVNVWQQARDAGVKIRAEDHDLHDEILATAIENTVARDGQNTASANLPMGGFRHTGVGAASARTDYARASQVQDSAMIFGGTSGGAGNAYTMTLTPTLAALAAGQQFIFVANHTNTGASTLNVNGIGATAIRQGSALTALAAGTIVSGQVVTVVYDGTYFVLTHGNALGGEVIMSNLVLSGTRSFLGNSSDGSDNQGLALCPAGACGVTRTASLELYANESAFNAGGVTLTSGSVSGAAFDITNGSSNGPIEFNTNSNERWEIQSDGDFSQEVNNGGNIVFNRDDSGIVDTSSSSVSAAGTLQSDATQLSKTVNLISTGSLNQGVKLPTAVAGRTVVVINQSGATLKLWPGTGASIDGGSANASINIATATSYILVGTDSTHWYRTSIQ